MWASTRDPIWWRRAAFVLVTHLRKAAADRAVHAIIGSIGLTAAARAAWIVTKDPPDPDPPASTTLARTAAGMPSA